MNSLPFAIKEMTKLDRPREKISRLGATSLSDVELLALIIGSGNKNQQVHKIAYNLLNLFDKNELEVSISKLSTIKGIGKMRSSQIEAAFEFCRRRFHPSTMSIRKPEDALPLFLPYVTRKQEHFLCTSLNGAYEVIKTRVVSIGLLNKTMVACENREINSGMIAFCKPPVLMFVFSSLLSASRIIDSAWI